MVFPRNYAIISQFAWQNMQRSVYTNLKTKSIFSEHSKSFQSAWFSFVEHKRNVMLFHDTQAPKGCTKIIIYMSHVWYSRVIYYCFVLKTDWNLSNYCESTKLFMFLSVHENSRNVWFTNESLELSFSESGSQNRMVIFETEWPSSWVYSLWD